MIWCSLYHCISYFDLGERVKLDLPMFATYTCWHIFIHRLMNIQYYPNNLCATSPNHIGLLITTSSKNYVLYLFCHVTPYGPSLPNRAISSRNWHHQNTRRITLALFAPILRPDMPHLGQALKERWWGIGEVRFFASKKNGEMIKFLWKFEGSLRIQEYFEGKEYPYKPSSVDGIEIINLIPGMVWILRGFFGHLKGVIAISNLGKVRPWEELLAQHGATSAVYHVTSVGNHLWRRRLASAKRSNYSDPSKSKGPTK